jgi:signal transduction histidine kinase
MNSLFSKILLWFLAALAITFFGFVYTTAYTMRESRSGAHLFGRMALFQLEEARHAYETGGNAALGAYVERFQKVFQAQGILTDSAGKDLLTGEDHSQLIGQALKRRPIPFVGRGRVVIARTSDDGKYWFLLVNSSQRPGFSFFLPQYLWIIGAVVLLAFGLALQLTSPLRKLQRAVERFGKGDFSTRVQLKGRDELARLAHTFDEMADRIQTLLTAERRLLMDISHELRSPLARLAVAVELARSGAGQEAAVNRIEKEADRLNSLVSELLQVTRAEGDPSSLRTEPVRLDQLLSDVAEDASVEAKARGCRIHFEQPKPLTFQGDPELLRRAIENVVRNAVRHAPPDSPVEIRLENGAPTARIRVRDFGPGVPEESIGRIFDPFYRVDTDRNRISGGAGLGLAIARRAVELHHGQIMARNCGPGLEVEIEFPVAAA